MLTISLLKMQSIMNHRQIKNLVLGDNLKTKFVLWLLAKEKGVC